MGAVKLDTAIRREQIVQAALEIVAAQGLRGLSVGAVARRVGLVPSGIYRHFASKDAILEAVLDLLEERLLANVRDVCQETPDALERLRRLLVRHAHFVREGRTIPRLIFSDDVHSGRPQRRLRVQRILGKYLGQIRRLVRQGQRQGQIDAALDPQTVAMLLLGIMAPAAAYWHLTGGRFDMAQHAGRAWKIVRAAVARGKA